MAEVTIALVRDPGPALARCELTHLAREPIDVERARRQHDRYLDALRDAGCEIVPLEPLPDAPDAVFVEDTAVVLDQVAVITRPGAESRRGETASVESVLRAWRPIRRILAPATLDGGDVLRAGRTLFVGRTGRTGAGGAAELDRAVSGLGYQVRPVPVTGCLHLKSAVTAVGDDTLLINPEWVDPAHFPGFRLIPVDPDEPFAANALRLGRRLIHAAAFPATAARLRAAGFEVVPVEADELAKAEGGVTCCALLVSNTVA